MPLTISLKVISSWGNAFKNSHFIDIWAYTSYQKNFLRGFKNLLIRNYHFKCRIAHKTLCAVLCFVPLSRS